MLLQARIDLKKPDVPALLRKGCTLFDMHFHTKYSDGITKPESIIKKAKKLRINLAITDHNVIEGAVRTYKIRDNVKIIPGIELTTMEGMHLLLYFYDINELVQYYHKHVIENKGKDPLSFLNSNAESLVDAARQYNCIISAAHPYAIGWTGLCKHFGEDNLAEKILAKIDALEIINGSNTKKANRKAQDFIQKTDKGITAGTDGHTIGELGRVLTYTKTPNQNINNFLDSIKQKTNFVIGKELNIARKAACHSVKIGRPIKDTANKVRKGMKYVKDRRIPRIKQQIRERINEINNIIQNNN